MLLSNNIIAVAGLKNSGKDTVAEMLQYLFNTPKILHSYWCFKAFKKIYAHGKYSIVNFAGPLKRTLSALLNIPLKYFNDRNFKENYYIYFPTVSITNKPNVNIPIITNNKFVKYINNKDLSFIQEYYITIRQLLQVFGTECMRNIFGNALWVNLTLKDKKPIIVSDLRFKIELAAIKDRGGKVVYVNRNNVYPGNHASEQEVYEMFKESKFDYCINNNGSLKDLFIHCTKIL